MKFLMIFGPPAVGKMAVGLELCQITGFKLLHNHMTIDLVLKFMTWEEGIDLIVLIREEITKRVARGNSKGMIITFIWGFNHQSDWDYVDNILKIFEEHSTYIVELNTDAKTRLKRNISENRLEKKWTKRDVEWSNNELLSSMSKHRMISHENEITYDNVVFTSTIDDRTTWELQIPEWNTLNLS